MMRSTFPLPDFTNLNHMPDWLMGWLFGKGLDYIHKNYKNILKPNNFRRNFAWLQIISLVVLTILFMVLSVRFSKIHAKPICYLLNIGVLSFVQTGFNIFKKIEPEGALALTKKFNDELIKHGLDKKTLIDSFKKMHFDVPPENR